MCFQECLVCECLERMGLVSYGNWNNAHAVLGAVPFNWVKILMYGGCFIYLVSFHILNFTGRSPKIKVFAFKRYLHLFGYFTFL